MASNQKLLSYIPDTERNQWVRSGKYVQTGPMNHEELYERRTPATNARNAEKVIANKARTNAVAADKAARVAIIGNKREVPFHESGWRLPRYHLITDNGYYVPLSEAEWTAYKAAYPNDSLVKMSIDFGTELDDATYRLRAAYYRAIAGSKSLDNFLQRMSKGYYPQANTDMKNIGLTANQGDHYSQEYANSQRAQAKVVVDKAVADLRAAFPPERVAELVPELARTGGRRKSRKTRKSKTRRSRTFRH